MPHHRMLAAAAALSMIAAAIAVPVVGQDEAPAPPQATPNPVPMDIPVGRWHRGPAHDRARRCRHRPVQRVGSGRSRELPQSGRVGLLRWRRIPPCGTRISWPRAAIRRAPVAVGPATPSRMKRWWAPTVVASWPWLAPRRPTRRAASSSSCSTTLLSRRSRPHAPTSSSGASWRAWTWSMPSSKLVHPSDLIEDSVTHHLSIGGAGRVAARAHPGAAHCV